MPKVINAELASCVPSFDTTEELWRGLAAKSNFEREDLYPRDGSRLLGEVEASIARLAGVNEDEVLVYNSGMSAVTDAIDIALHTTSRPDTLPTIACAEDTYSQTKRYIEHFLRESKAKVIYFDSGENEEIARVLDQWQPEVVISETVSNYINVPVLDVDFLLSYARNKDKPPTLVLDNTLPLSTAQPLGDKIQESDALIVVESGTKSYTFNSSISGIGYSKNPGLLHWLRRYRRTRGTLPDPVHLERIGELLPGNREVFDERNRSLFKNTGDIALSLAVAAGYNDDFVISYPGLPSHANYDFYKQNYAEGGAPLLYICSTKFDQRQILHKLWGHPGVREWARLGQSFGFDHTRIVPDEFAPTVRVAGGAKTDGEAMGKAAAEALYG